MIEDTLGHRFRRRELLDQALIHSSYAAERPNISDNERLEFLGDAVLQLVVTDYVFDAWPDLPEGELAKIRAASVSGEQLASVARSIGLGVHVALGRGEESSGGRNKDSILADTMEAVLAAVYLDGGYEAARDVVLKHWEERIDASAADPGRKDFKTRLQELLARRGVRPVYRIAEEGLDHDKTFTATVEIENTAFGTGVGRTKKQAEQRAARTTLDEIGDNESAGAT
ncbi:MAG: ribonuclease III [Acidimicrobiia bacterium]